MNREVETGNRSEEEIIKMTQVNYTAHEASSRVCRYGFIFGRNVSQTMLSSWTTTTRGTPRRVWGKSDVLVRTRTPNKSD